MKITAFKRLELVNDGTDTSLPEVSRAIEVGRTNAMLVSLTVIELTTNGTPSVTVTLEGSNDMQAWVDLGFSLSSAMMGSSQALAEDIASTYVRCRAVLDVLESAPASALIAVEFNAFNR